MLPWTSWNGACIKSNLCFFWQNYTEITQGTCAFVLSKSQLSS